MKKYLINILVFFAIVAVVDFGIGWVGDYLQAHAGGGVTRRTNDFVMKDTYDVIILGSSRAHHHYDTPFLSDTLGLDVYNAGYDGNGVVLATGFLELILERYRPKLVLFDVEPAFDIIEYTKDNNHIRYIGNLKPYYRHAAIGDIIQDISTEEWYKVHSGMIRYNTRIITMFQDLSGEDKHSLRGFEPLIGVYAGDLIEKCDVTEKDELKLGYIKKMIRLAQTHNIPICLVASPKYGQTSSEVMRPVKEICEKYNVNFYDYYISPKFILNKDYFKEPMHLNGIGAREYSRIIASILSSYLQ